MSLVEQLFQVEDVPEIELSERSPINPFSALDELSPVDHQALYWNGAWAPRALVGLRVAGVEGYLCAITDPGETLLLREARYVTA